AMNSVQTTGLNVQYAFFGDSSTNLASGYATQYCGWHTHTSSTSGDVAYLATIDTPQSAMSACAAQAASPNNDPGLDAMLSVVAHELEETATDVDLNAWFDNVGNENADKCAWTFGATKVAANGSRYNVTLGDVNYLIQQNWVNANGGN